MKQFASLDLNNLKPDVDLTMTKAQYFFKKSRLLAKKRKIFEAYIKRSDNRGRKTGVYDIEELATVWHFPVEANVKASMVQKAPGRKADAPSSLPLAEEGGDESLPDIFHAVVPESLPSAVRPVSSPPKLSEDLTTKNAAPPANLPFV